MRDVVFGQYYPSGSSIHHLDPRVKIVFSIFYMVGVFFAKTYISFAIILGFLLFTIVVSKVPLIIVIKNIKSILFFIIFAFLLNILTTREGYVLASWGKLIITLEGLHNAIYMTLRITLLVIGTSLLTLTTTATELTDALEYLLSPLKLIKVPVHDLAIIMALALRFVPGFIEETDKIIMAQKARGANFDNGPLYKRLKAYIPVLIPLFVNAFRKADDLADALDSRCYNATDKRTKMNQLKITYRDIVATIIILAFFIVVFLDYADVINFTIYDQKLFNLIKSAKGV